MSTRSLVRAIHIVHGEQLEPNWLKDETQELEARGFIEKRAGAWAVTSAGRRFIREHGDGK